MTVGAHATPASYLDLSQYAILQFSEAPLTVQLLLTTVAWNCRKLLKQAFKRPQVFFVLDGTVVTNCKVGLHCTIRVVSKMCTVKVGLYNNFVVSETKLKVLFDEFFSGLDFKMCI